MKQRRKHVRHGPRARPERPAPQNRRWRRRLLAIERAHQAVLVELERRDRGFRKKIRMLLDACPDRVVPLLLGHNPEWFDDLIGERLKRL
jgi:hypothetical protein